MSKSIITKNALAAGLKALVAENIFDKITISDITAYCGLNRQTFYYHFQDKLDLLYWIYDREAFVFTHDLSVNNWGHKLNLFLKHLRKDRLFYVNTIKSSRDYLEEYMTKALEELFVKAAYDYDEKGELDEKEVILVAKFMSRGLSGVIIEWITNGMKENEDEITNISIRLVNNAKKVVYEHYLEERELT